MRAKSSPRTLAKYLEKSLPTGCFVFQNLRLGGIKLRADKSVNRRNVRNGDFRTQMTSCRRLTQPLFCIEYLEHFVIFHILVVVDTFDEMFEMEIR